MKHPSLPTILLTALSLCWGSSVYSSVIVTYAELPSAENSTLSGTQVFDFNSLPLGVNNNVTWSGVGTFNQLNIKSVDQYGGAVDSLHPNGTNYAVEGVGSVSTTTLTLNQDSGYFGMWWSAGDANNVLDFYNNGSLVAEFTTANLLQVLGPEYDGNPRNRALNSAEPYAFINFFADAHTSWDQIVFRNAASSGFEGDNYTTRVSTWNPPTDGPLPGVTVARVDGPTVTKLPPGSSGKDLWGSTGAIPGAPAPPLPLLFAFGAMALVKSRKKRGATAAV